MTPWTPPDETTGGRIRRLRLHYRLEQRDLAASTGLNKNTLSNIENDRFPAREATIRLVAAAFAAADGNASEEQIRAWLTGGSPDAVD